MKNSLEKVMSHSKDALNQFLKSDQVIDFHHIQQPIISVVIVTYNKAEITLPCLLSLKKNITVPFELILIDNASTDSTRLLYEKINCAHKIMNDNNIFYAAAVNLGASRANGKYILLLNNDIQLFNNFDIELIKIFDLHKNVGAVGGQLVYLDGRVQEAGCMIWSDGTPWGYFRGASYGEVETLHVREVDYCSAAFVLTLNDLFKRVGGFSRNYEPAYFEDTDYSMKIREQGFKFMYTPFATAYHHEHGSSDINWVLDLLAKNQRKFLINWKDVLQKTHFNKNININIARERVQGQRILIIDNRVPVPSNGGGYPRANKLVRDLVALGHKLTLFPLKKHVVEMSSWEEESYQLRLLGVEIIDSKVAFSDFLASRVGNYDKIIVSRFSVLDQIFSSLKSILPTAKIIFDSEALEFERKMLIQKFEKNHNVQELDEIRDKELKLMKYVDHVVFISKREQTIATKYLAELKNKSSVLGHSVKPKDNIKQFDVRSGILFVGGFLGNFNLNEHAISHFIHNIQIYLGNSPQSKLKIVGSNMPQSVRDLESDKTEVLGFVENLDNIYSTVKVFIAPHKFAGGIPLKILEALSYGVPCVVSKLIAEQLDIDENCGVFITDDDKEFANYCLQLIQDKNLWNIKSQQAIDFVKNFHSNGEWLESLNKIISSK